MNTKSPKRILYITPCLNRAGAQLHVLSLVINLDPKQYKSKVCVVANDLGPLAEEFKNYNIEVDWIKYSGEKDLKFLIKFYAYLKKQEVDIIHIHDLPFVGIFITIMAKIKKIPVICTLHGIWNFKGLSARIFKLLFFIGSKFCDKYIAVSKFSKNYWNKNYNLPLQKIEIIYNGVDARLFQVSQVSTERLKNYLKFSEDVIIIGTVGSLSPVKGHEFLINAFSLVLKRYKNSYCIIVGNGSLYKELRDLAGELGVGENIIFLGFRDNINEILNLFDIFVFPSAFNKENRIAENCPLALIEAMLCAKPIVASTLGGIPELIVNNETGILVPPNDSKALAEAIVKLIQDKELRKKLGMNARKKAEQEFNVNLMMSRIMGVYSREHL